MQEKIVWSQVLHEVLGRANPLKGKSDRLRLMQGPLPKLFPDVSFWQGDIDWDKMREHTDIVIMRAGQGILKDKKFEQNYAEARKRGLLVAIYWFYDDRHSPGAQSDALKKALEGKFVDLEIFWDWESTYGGKFGGVKNVVAAMEATERAFPGTDVGMYTGYYWFLEHTHAILNFPQLNYLKKKKLWLGWYTNWLPNVKIPRPWTQIYYWQYGTPVIDMGQQSQEIDMNRLMVSEAEFYDQFKQEGDAMFKGKTNQLAKVWASVGGGQVDELQPATEVRGYAPAGDYVQLVSPVAGWTKKAWLSNYVQEPVTPPPDDPPPPPTEPTVKHIIYIYTNGSYRVDNGPIIP